MTLLNAPSYNEGRERLKKNLLIGSALTVFLLVILTLAGFMLGHGWLFTNLPAEHRVSAFLTALEKKDYDTAYGLYNNDASWKEHAAKYSDYPQSRFIEDWTTESPVGAPLASHHVDISKTDGSGSFGTGIIVAVTVKSTAKPADQRLFLYYIKQDGTLTYPAPHILEY